MFKRLRQLRISLATKCQLLFGAAVVLIIGAALFVPWHRIEQLTEQLNERAAGALADATVAQHMVVGNFPGLTSRLGAPASPTSAPSTTQPGTDEEVASPTARLVPLDPHRDDSEASRFDRRAMAHFSRHTDPYWVYYDREDGKPGYRYAKPLYYDPRPAACGACHTTATITRRVATTEEAIPTTGSSPELAANTPATAPATQPATAKLIPLEVEPITRRAGIVSVDIGSRIDASELLLNRVFIFAAFLLAGTLAIVTFYLITTRLILQPVRVLQETAEKVSQGDLNIRSDINTGDEFQQLSDTFNVMLANLKLNADQLRSVNKSLDLRLGQLAESNVALYESNRLKSEFLANVSHELRTPLNSILGFADLLKDAVNGSPEAKSTRYINNILSSGRNLLDLINDLLDLAKIEAGKMEIRSEPLSLTDLFEGLGTLLRPLSEQKGLQIVPSVAADVPILHSDPGKLQQVLYNFLSNAIKFSPDNSQIDLTAVLDDPERVHIAVADRGPGIDPEKHDVIFEKFRQIDASVTRAHGGSGLGLAISKELTFLMGGTIGVRSLPGQGATFWIILPVKIQSGQMDVRARMVLT